ncbi:hypothetical protein CDL12_17151 [Handroanthus impetiginosus]|uniref:Uncharacterized protein n=1 Tax=Handroanthus impetiginosus TaxID=429701 RepID=A0A2G9GYA8_9LAMI|nr:hypothetical protein CDL12_17151 [Handroanthus impetiginosus]
MGILLSFVLVVFFLAGYRFLLWNRKDTPGFRLISFFLPTMVRVLQNFLLKGMPFSRVGLCYLVSYDC